MNIYEYLSRLTDIIVSNNFDLPSSGRESRIENRYYGPDKTIQEKIKEEGRKLIAGASSLDDKLIGYGLEAYSHFYRSLESATEQDRVHPEKFSEYFPHWIYSDTEYMTNDVFSKFSGLFSKPRLIKIKKGESYWKYHA